MLTDRIAIEQDSEYDPDEGLGSELRTFWAPGHGHDPDAFVRAVIDHCLDYSGSVPAIDAEEHEPVEVWQETVEHGDALEYRRTDQPPTSPRSKLEPITMLDLERRTRGAIKCAVIDCRKPYSAGLPARVLIEPTNGDRAHMHVRMWLCRDHTERFPGPSYRVCMIPVGAEILLPAAEAGAAEVIS